MRLIEGPVTPEIISGIISKGQQKTECGAHAIFLGQVRNDIVEGREVKAIDYSAYEEMVIMEADKISKTLLSEFDDVAWIEILHSKGEVPAGRISLMVFVSAGHRGQASKACARAVELIKEKLPIWKKEIFSDDSSRWRENE
ncbi:MAG TPA: molybdenum cofactor biosynthesis protein MoaE [Bacteroidales bacterium]|nr:molybdenum cofactor biosynthesis protein MoaE [Bacteroidales bacterium]